MEPNEQNEGKVGSGPWDKPKKPKTFGFTSPELTSSTGRFSDAVIFAIFAFLGIACELTAHAFTKNTMFIIAGPVFFLLSYLATCFLYRGFRLRFDQLGDNCYYLGFLFTLTALSIALYDFRGLEIEISTIVSNFGVALASTILGVILRVLLSQMREDPIEVEEQSRYELAQASAMLKNELYASVRDMGSFRGLLQQSISETFEEANEKTKEAILKEAEEFSKEANKTNQEITIRNDQLGKKFEHFNNLTQRSVTSLETLVESLEKIKPPNELIQEAFEKTVISMENLREETEKTYRITEQQRDVTQSKVLAASDAIQKVSEDLSKLSGEGSPLNSVVSNLHVTSENLEMISKNIENLSINFSSEVNSQKDKLDEFNSVTSDSVQIIKMHNSELTDALTHNREMLSEVEKNLAEMARALVKAVG